MDWRRPLDVPSLAATPEGQSPPAHSCQAVVLSFGAVCFPLTFAVHTRVSDRCRPTNDKISLPVCSMLSLKRFTILVPHLSELAIFHG